MKNIWRLWGDELKREKRGLWSMLFGDRQQSEPYQNRLINRDMGQWGSFVQLYQSDEVRKVIDRIATQAAKMNVLHVRTDKDGNQSTKDSHVVRLLSQKPNAYMSTYDFIYKIVSLLYINNNVFVFPYYENGQIKAFYPIDANQTELIRDDYKNLWVRFTFQNGATYVVMYEDIIHLRRFYAVNEIAGDTDHRSILNSVNVAQTALDSVANSIRISSRVLGILDLPGALKDKDKDTQLNELASFLESAMEHGGFIPSDAKGTIRPLSLDPKMAQKPLLEAVTGRVRSYFGVSDAIVEGDFTEVQFSAFYETVLEPLSVQFSQAFTNNLLKGNTKERLIFEASPIAYTSWGTKLQMIKELTPFGLFDVDEGRALLGLPPLPNQEGKRRVQSLNYVNQQGADQYQGVKGEQNEPIPNQKPEGDEGGGDPSIDPNGS